MGIRLSRALLVLAVGAFACGDDDNGPTNGGDGNGNGNGNGNGGGEVGAVTVGNIFFRSDHNGTTDPAIDTVAVNSAVTWTWRGTETSQGATPHSVRSEGSPSFASSETLTGDGQTYSVTFTERGTYEYDCAVHGDQMTGRVVVE